MWPFILGFDYPTELSVVSFAPREESIVYCQTEGKVPADLDLFDLLQQTTPIARARHADRLKDRCTLFAAARCLTIHTARSEHAIIKGLEQLMTHRSLPRMRWRQHRFDRVDCFHTHRAIGITTQ